MLPSLIHTASLGVPQAPGAWKLLFDTTVPVGVSSATVIEPSYRQARTTPILPLLRSMRSVPSGLLPVGKLPMMFTLLLKSQVMIEQVSSA